MARVMVGVISLRANDGSFLPSVPIHRDIPKPKNEDKAYIPLDDLAAIFADKFSKHKKEEKRL